MTNPRQRALIVLVFLSFGFTLVSLRLVDIMLEEHDRWEDYAIANHLRSIELPARRGPIVDARGDVLAQTHVLYDVRIDGKLVKNPTEDFAEMARILELSPTMLARAFDPSNRYWLIKQDIDEDTLDELKALRLRFLVPPEKKFIRSYPNGSHASHVLGYLTHKGRGADGIERLADRLLEGTPGERWIEKDGRQVEIAAYRRSEVPPKTGHTVKLTLDMTVQHVIEDGLDKIMAEHQPLGAYAVVMRPDTGEILALANRPAFNPNDRSTMQQQEVLRNRALTDIVEPGSVFKIVAFAGALNDGLVSLDTPVYCERGEFYYGGHTLHDHAPYDMLSVKQGMAKSSNILTAKLALDLGEERFYEYIRRFGFGKRTRLIPTQRESAGILRPVSTWEKVAATRICIGQGIGVTPVQMVTAMAAIANGGFLMQPQIVKEIVDADGNIVEGFEPKVVRRVVSADAAADVAESLQAVVEPGGTGTTAAVPGYTVAGKTGTAEKFIDGAYRDKYVASFVGFLPVEKPEFVLAVMVDEPSQGKFYGGQVAGPAFSDMSQKIAQCLNLVPDVHVPRAAPVIRTASTAALP